MTSEILAHNWPAIAVSLFVLVAGLFAYGELKSKIKALEKDHLHLKGNYKNSQELGRIRDEDVVRQHSELKGWVKARVGLHLDNR